MGRLLAINAEMRFGAHRRPRGAEGRTSSSAGCIIAAAMHSLVVLGIVAVCTVSASGQNLTHAGKTLVEWQARLDSSEQIERLLAVRALGEMAIAQNLEAEVSVISALEHADGAVRYWALVAVSEMERPGIAGVEALERLLRDSVPENRVQAAVALIRSGEKSKALATLEELLKHRNRGVRLQAVHAADALGESARPLTDALRESVEDDFDYVQRVARHALWALGERPCPYRACQ